MNNNQNISNGNTPRSQTAPHQLAPNTNDDLRYHGTELVMLYDYKVCEN